MLGIPLPFIVVIALLIILIYVVLHVGDKVQEATRELKQISKLLSTTQNHH